ncbi:MAG: response regulator containing a CheY-like receiver domain and an domain [Alphaproteobacteria bacterium]|jgi:two-component system response regulator|nr:response regulator containing a CheY-like receiver domain and an domain [Alphaproteobacteria bacterium]MDF3034135.1 response regulator containing a CheY-like receiver domain and an domain [Alphaproteobacteria bacterium]
MPLNINELDLYLGKRLKAFRLKMNWPLKTLAMKLGVSPQQLQRYETGMNKISASLLYTIAHELNTDVAFFYEGYEGLPKSLPLPQTPNNILLIEENRDDEALFRQALMEFPEKLNIYSCHDGEEAVNFFRRLEESAALFFPKPDLIFLDLMIPGINGFDVLKDIKRRSSVQNTPVVIFSRNASHEDMLRSYCLHASGFINMSFSYNEVREQIHKTLAYWIHTVTLPSSGNHDHANGVDSTLQA